MGLFFVYFVLLKHKFKCRLQRNFSSGCRNADHNTPLFYILIKQLTSMGRGWWSSGQRACLLLRQFEFKSR